MDETKEPLSVRISTSLTPSQAAFVDKEAGAVGMSRAEYLRYLVDEEIGFAGRAFIKLILKGIDSIWRRISRRPK